MRTLQDTPANSREGLDEAGRVWMKGEGPGLCGKDLDQNGPARRRGVEQATLAVGVAGVAAAAKIGVLPTDAVEVGAAGRIAEETTVALWPWGTFPTCLARWKRAPLVLFAVSGVPHRHFGLPTERNGMSGIPVLMAEGDCIARASGELPWCCCTTRAATSRRSTTSPTTRPARTPR